MLILGLNAYHGDSAACLVRDGQLVAAAEEERFRRIKHWAGLPTQAIRYCLQEGGITLADIDHIAVNRQPGVNNLRRLGFVLTRWPDPRLVWQKICNMRKAQTIEDALRKEMGASGPLSSLPGPSSELRATVHHVEHHLAHLASAFLVSPFQEAVCLSVDGFGDFASAAWGMGQGNQIAIDGHVFFPHSLGIFYSAITQFIGFPHYGDEYKVMGLAPYGQLKYLEQMRQIVHLQPDGTFRLNLRYFRHHTGNVSYSWNECAPEVGLLFRTSLNGAGSEEPGARCHAHTFSDLLGPPRHPGEPLEQRHKDIARSAQAMYEEAFFALLDALHARYRCPSLALSGGCAMNSVANGKVYLRSPFRRMYLPAAAGDAGGAIGAALLVSAGLGARSIGQAPRCRLSQAYLGPAFDEGDIRALLAARFGRLSKEEGALPWLPAPSSPLPAGMQAASSPFPAARSLTISHLPSAEALCSRVARAIADGQVVGWFQGRMEWGPRALGNRSILGDPRRPDMKEILNAKIKRRESFRPFAPSILREHVSGWFEQDDDVPFMMQVFQVRTEKRSLLPAVCHVDGSGRLQTVHRETNPLYHQLISEFHRLTGVPMVLNTSFNENEPVVCSPEQALDCFLRTQMDLLVLGSFLVERGVPSEERRQGAGEITQKDYAKPAPRF